MDLLGEHPYVMYVDLDIAVVMQLFGFGYR